eukprot:31784-Amphidinium_carterae.1
MARQRRRLRDSNVGSVASGSAGGAQAGQTGGGRSGSIRSRWVVCLFLHGRGNRCVSSSLVKGPRHAAIL